MYGYGYRYNSGLVVSAGGGAPFSNTKSLSFDGVDDYVDCGNMSGLDAVQNFTISAWVNFDNVSGTKRMIGKRHNFVNFIAFNFSSNVLVAGVNSAGVTSSLGLVAGTWYHIAMVFDGTLTGNANRLKIYVDGAQKTLSFTGTIPSVTYDFALNPTTFYLGTDGFTTPNYFGGKMDEVSIFNTSEPIANLWDGSGTPTDLTSLNPIAWWRMGDGDTYPTITDNGSGGNNGTMTNMDAGDIVSDVPL